MTNQKKIELKVGIVSIVAIVLLIVGISLGKGVNVSVNKQIVKFRFDNSGGITEGSPIVVNGVKRGNVTSVANNDGSVLISAEMDNIADLKTDAFATITILEITGGKKIELNPGISNTPFNKSNIIPGKASADIADLVAILGGVSGNLVSLVSNLDTLTVGLNQMMSGGKLAADIQNIATNTSELTGNLNNLIKNNYATLQTTINNLNTLLADIKKTYTKQEPNINKIIGQIDVALTNANSLLAKLQNTVEKADATLADVGDITKEIKSGDGLVNKLIYDKALVAQIDSTVNSLNVLLNQINNHGVNVNVRLGTRP